MCIYRIEFPNGTKQYTKTIYATPTEYFTQEVIDELELIAQQEFQYGIYDEEDEVEIEEEEKSEINE